MKLKRDLHLEVSRKLHNTVSVKVFAFRNDCAYAERVCLGTLHMPDVFFRSLRKVFELGLQLIGARVTVCGSYFAKPDDKRVA